MNNSMQLYIQHIKIYKHWLLNKSHYCSAVIQISIRTLQCMGWQAHQLVLFRKHLPSPRIWTHTHNLPVSEYCKKKILTKTWKQWQASRQTDILLRWWRRRRWWWWYMCMCLVSWWWNEGYSSITSPIARKYFNGTGTATWNLEGISISTACTSTTRSIAIILEQKWCRGQGNGKPHPTSQDKVK